MERGFIARESWAFEAAYRTFAGELFGCALGVLRDTEEAEDCVHDVLLRLWKQGHAYRAERGSLRSFLTVCVRNEALSRYRKRSNRERIERLLPQAESFEDPDVSAYPDRERIAKALAELPGKQREAIAMAYFRALTHEQIASELGEPLGTVKSRLSNALRSLRGSLAAEGGA